MSVDPAPTRDSSETVLVVDDDVLLRLVLAEYLRDCGYTVVEAADAADALTVLRDASARIDTVFSSVVLPGDMDGFALATWIRRNRPGVEVILAGSVPRAANEAAELCSNGPMPRPYDPKDVVRRLRRLRGSRPGA